MKSSYEDNYKELQKINLEVNKLKEELDNLNISINYIKSNYPDGTIYELLSSDKSIEDYKQNIMRLKEEQIELEKKNAKYNEKLKEQEMLQTLIDNYKENLKNKINDNRKNINERKLEKERKAQELEIAKQDFKNNFELAMKEKGILKSDIATKISNEIFYSKCLSEQEKSEYRTRLNEKLDENNKLLNTPNIKIKEPIVNSKKQFKIKNKISSVIAKGKSETVNAIKGLFNKSIGKTVNGIKEIYQKYHEKVNNNSQKKLDELYDTISELMQQMEEVKKDYEKLKMSYSTSDYIDEEILNLMSETQINDSEEKEEMKKNDNISKNEEYMELFRAKKRLIEEKKANILQESLPEQGLKM